MSPLLREGLLLHPHYSPPVGITGKDALVFFVSMNNQLPVGTHLPDFSLTNHCLEMMLSNQRGLSSWVVKDDLHSDRKITFLSNP
jgi:hypothetical protein